tara:strand:+ start:6985 stop:8211 length:1227 start_codon:yes stop_codon:yes gene_type:complete
MNNKLIFYIFVGFFLFSVPVFACQESSTKICGEYDEGECRYGTQYCENGQWGFCIGQILPVDELCDDGKDNDCDGLTDEGCECQEGENRTCGPQNETGICKFGVEFCSPYGDWSGSCQNETMPEAEKCGALGTGNGLDDNCNGEVDEICAPVVTGVVLTCTNRIKDSNEEKIDCGGPDCDPCNDCADGVLERDEKKVNVDLGMGNMSDCGGLNCPKCPTCNDKIKNQGEEDVDCGSPCPVSCFDPMLSDEDEDGLTLAVEKEKGTNPKSADTDGDGIIDSTDAWPLCPNNFCDVLRGETEENCPDDCKEVTGMNALIAIIIVVILIVAVVLFFYFHYRSSAKKVESAGVGFPGLESYSGGGVSRRKKQKRTFSRTYLKRRTTRPSKMKERETETEKKLRKSVESIRKK